MEKIKIEVSYGEPQQQHIEVLEVDKGTTVGDVLAMPLHLKKLFPKMIIDTNAIGIFSKHISMDKQLSEGNRIEIYRPLIIDPKEARRQRAHNQDSPKSSA